MGPSHNPYKWPKINGFSRGVLSPRNKWSYFGPLYITVFGPNLVKGIRYIIRSDDSDDACGWEREQANFVYPQT